MGLYLSATVVFRLVNFVRIWLLAWFMTLEQMGLLNMILMVVSVLIPMCSFGLNDAIVRFVPMHESRGTFAAFFRRSAMLICGVAVVTIGLLAAFATNVGGLLFAQMISDPIERAALVRDATPLALMAALAAGLSVLYFFLLAVFRGLRMFGALARLEIAHALLFLVAALAMTAMGRGNALALTAVFAGSIALPVLVLGGRLIRRVRDWGEQRLPLAEGGWEARLLRYGVWAMLSGVTWQALQYYSTWYLNKTHGSEPVAVFTTVQKIAQFILIGAVSVSTVAMTTVTKTWESQGRDAAERQLSLAFRGTGLALFFLCAALALAKDAIMLIFRSDYAPGAAVMPLQLMFFLLGGYLAFLPGYFNLREKTRYGFWAWGAGIAANAMLAFYLTGPNHARVAQSALWKTLGPPASAVFAPAFSDTMGLHGASWCAAGGMSVATALCVLLIRIEGGRLDRGTLIVIAAALLLAMKWWMLAAGAALLAVVALRTNAIFDADERRRMLSYAVGTLRSVPIIGALFR